MPFQGPYCNLVDICYAFCCTSNEVNRIADQFRLLQQINIDRDEPLTIRGRVSGRETIHGVNRHRWRQQSSRCYFKKMLWGSWSFCGWSFPKTWECPAVVSISGVTLLPSLLKFPQSRPRIFKNYKKFKLQALLIGYAKQVYIHRWKRTYELNQLRASVFRTYKQIGFVLVYSKLEFFSTDYPINLPKCVQSWNYRVTHRWFTLWRHPLWKTKHLD